MTNESSISVAIGPSGSGKTSGVFLPRISRIIEKGESFVTPDSKYELLTYMGKPLQENGYKIVVFNTRDVKNSMSWNPLIMPYRCYREGDINKATSLLLDLADDIFPQGSDVFWENASKDLFTGLAMILFSETIDESQVNIKSLYRIGLEGFEKIGSKSYLQEYVSQQDDILGLISSNLYTAINAPPETRGGITSVFYQGLRNLTSYDKLINVLTNSNIDLNDCLKEKVAVFIAYEDENVVFSQIVNVILTQIYRFLVRFRTENNKQHKTFHIILDDFLLLPKIKKLDEMLLGCKNRCISLAFGINNLRLLDKKYGTESSELLLSNADIITLFTGLMSKDKELLCGLFPSVGEINEIENGNMCIIQRNTPLSVCSIPQWPNERYDFSSITHTNDMEISTFNLKQIVEKRFNEKLKKHKKIQNENDRLGEDVIRRSWMESLLGSSE